MSASSVRGPDTGWVVTAGFALVVALTYILFSTPSASAYEMSIYEAYPWYFWALAVLALLIGHYAVLERVFGGESDSGAWRLGLLLILVVEALLLLLPYFRGYPVFGRGDVLTHVGQIVTIQATGVAGQQDIYPNLHFLVLSFSYASGVEPIHLINSVAVVISLFSLVASFALVSTVYDRTRAFLSLPFVTLLIGGTAHVNPSPFPQSVLLVPFVLYLFFKEQQTRSTAVRVALVVTAAAMVVYHPLTTLFLLFVFGVYTAAKFVHDQGLLTRDSGRSVEWRSAVGATPIAHLALGMFAAWYLDFTQVTGKIQTVIQTFVATESGTSTLDSYSSTVSEASPALIDLVQIGVVKYGMSAILLSLAGLYALWTLSSPERRRDLDIFRTTFLGGFVLFAGLAVPFLIMDLVVGFGRPLMLARIFAALLVGSLFYALYRSVGTGGKRVVQVGCYVVLACLVVISTFGLYYSPYAIERNHQVTSAELDGADWTLEFREPDNPTIQYGINLRRFRDALYGTAGYTEDEVIPASTTVGPPPHFNYTEHDTLGASYEEDRYMVVTRSGRIFYEEMYPDYRQFWQFNDTDYARLERDGSVSHVYANGGYDTYLVNSTVTA
ncbi:hypothetical protein NDI76_12985 [Halogeometricum sp. S1BR25-6]|uniref:Glycosyltransferase RgtA/B/C/D-like domain-containing protein n=1 Tax=Halogeometricum salsisoli TaxID=2950536 RepID=A0ABU2GFS9_9EURY|nr:hypothetical protein [Halogeometricum sp. S1BR25-6]MDS0299657.1 hypothetical protein [Halogeometricum sp. S1BR25-6]